LQVKSKYGHSFDRSCILKWLQQHANTCPVTNQPLAPADLSPDAELEKRIHGWQIQQTLKQQRAKIIGPAFVPNAHHKSMLTQSIITHPMNIASLCPP
jgi:hypothetical protein